MEDLEREDEVFKILTYELVPLLADADRSLVATVVSGILDTWCTEHGEDCQGVIHTITQFLRGGVTYEA